MKWKSFVMWLVLFSLISLPGILGAQDEISIFSSADSIMQKPVTLGCQPCSANHGARLQGDKIVWRWKGKYSCWCGWTLKGGVISKVDNLSGYSLEIMYKGAYSGSPSPQVKFMDSDGNATQLKDFSKYRREADSNGFIRVLIPIRDFAMDFSINEKAIDKIQFDAGWDSPNGKIVIKSIVLKKN